METLVEDKYCISVRKDFTHTMSMAWNTFLGHAVLDTWCA